MYNDPYKIKTLEVLRDTGSLKISGMDDALIGYSEIDNTIVAVYDQDVFIDILADDIPYSDAVEFFYKTFSSNRIGKKNPIFVRLDHNI